MSASPTTVFLRTDMQGNITVWRNMPDTPQGYVRTEFMNRDGERVWAQTDSRGVIVCHYIEADLLG